MPAGAIVTYPNAAPPDRWLLCDGASYDIAEYPRLAEALGQSGNPSGLFSVPDLRDRFILGAGARFIGDTGGTESVTLTEAQMPSHGHDNLPHSHFTGNSTLSAAAPPIPPAIVPVLAPNPLPASTFDAGVTILNAGGSQPHDNMPPFYVAVWIIST